MGYCATQRDSEFTIKAENKAPALNAIKILMDQANGMGNGGTRDQRHFSWVDTQAVIDSTSLFEALSEWGYDTSIDDEGNLNRVMFVAEKLGQEYEMWKAIAPFVEPNSFIVMDGEDGCTWRWYFNGSECLEQEGRVVFGDETPVDPVEALLKNERIIPEDY